MRTIDANTLWEVFENAGWWDNADRDIAQDLLDKAPTIDVEPVRHGQWETKIHTIESDGWITEYREEVCSECGEEQIGISNYCPNCGAKMDLEEENK